MRRHYMLGASALEQWALERNELYKALYLREQRGESVKLLGYPEEEVAYEKQVNINVIKSIIHEWDGELERMTNEHLYDKAEFDPHWSELQDYLELLEQKNEAEQQVMKMRDNYLRCLTIDDIFNLGYEAEGAWDTETEYTGRYEYSHDVEVWRFPDGTKIKSTDGLSFAHKLGILDRL